MEITTIHYLNLAGNREKFSGLWIERAAGIVFIHTKASQTLIPWHRVVMIEQTITGGGMEQHEIYNKQISQRLRRD